MGQPHGGILQRLRRQLAVHGAALLGTHHQSRLLQHAQVLHEAGQRHPVGLRQLGHRRRPAREALDHVAPRPVGKRGEHLVEHVGIGGHPYMAAAGCSMLKRLRSVSKNAT
jgi:hypothetical protein